MKVFFKNNKYIQIFAKHTRRFLPFSGQDAENNKQRRPLIAFLLIPLVIILGVAFLKTDSLFDTLFLTGNTCPVTPDNMLATTSATSNRFSKAIQPVISVENKMKESGTPVSVFESKKPFQKKGFSVGVQNGFAKKENFHRHYGSEYALEKEIILNNHNAKQTKTGKDKHFGAFGKTGKIRFKRLEFEHIFNTSPVQEKAGPIDENFVITGLKNNQWDTTENHSFIVSQFDSMVLDSTFFESNPFRNPNKIDKTERFRHEFNRETDLPDYMDYTSDPVIQNIEPFSAIPGIEAKTSGPLSLEGILAKHYSKDHLYEKKAFERIEKLIPSIQQITEKYVYLNPLIMAAVIKVETQGLKGQMSHKKAIGLPQIKYQGAYAFMWKAMHQEFVVIDGKKQKDYYNHMLRKRYKSQLDHIENYLQKKGIMVSPDTSDKAQWLTWQRLKKFLREKKKQNDYLVDVEIAAMYLDHLIRMFKHHNRKVTEIRDYLISNPVEDIKKIAFRGTNQIIWKGIQKNILSEIESETAKKQSRSISNNTKTDILDDLPFIKKYFVNRLTYIIKKTDSPLTWYAAYNQGPTLILKRIKKQKDLPKYSKAYAQNVKKQIQIFREWDRLSHKAITYREDPFPFTKL